MEKELACDIAIIGAGAAGLSVAAGASQLGARVVLIEIGKMGGDCLNTGCVPSKSLLAAAKAAYQAKEAENLGIHAEVTIDFKRVMSYVRQVIAELAYHDSVKRFESLGVNVIKAKASFVSPKLIQAGSELIRPKFTVIATGSRPMIPEIPGLNETRYLTNETIFHLKNIPEHLIIIGAGPIGCEMAQAFSMLGSRVTLIEANRMLLQDEPDCVAILKSKMTAMDIRVLERTIIHRVNGLSEKILIDIEQNGKSLEIEGSHLLVATGRKAELEGLGLDSAGVNFTSKGITTDHHLRTSQRKIYALGDVIGEYQFTHMASYQASIVLKNILFKLPAKVKKEAIPWVTYSYPEVAHVGLREHDLENRNNITILDTPLSEIDRAHADSQLDGKIKVIVDRRGGILGATIVAPNAGDLILPWVIAVKEKKKLRSFTDVIVPYPTYSEISKKIAGKFYQPKLFSKKVRGLVRFLLFFSRR